MARNYRHIQQYEKEIIELKEKGLMHKEIGQRIGFTKEQVKGFIRLQHKKERKIAAMHLRFFHSLHCCNQPISDVM